ncbi:MAG: hypothetical protein U0R51_01585 [Solirubrobacterales bacterium]
MAPEASAEQRLLHELLIYMEEGGIAVADPVKHDTIQAFALAQSSIDLLWELLDRAGELSELEPDGGPAWRPKESVDVLWQTFRPSEWETDFGGYPEILCSFEDGWARTRLDEPAIGLGITIPGDHYEVLVGQDLAEWRSNLQRADLRVDVGEYAGWTRVFHTLYLAELTISGATLEQQAQSLANRFDSVISMLRSHRPDLGPSMSPNEDT